MASKIALPRTVSLPIESTDPHALVKTAAVVGLCVSGYAWMRSRKTKRTISSLEKRIEKFEAEIEDFILIQNEQIIMDRDKIIGLDEKLTVAHEDICVLASAFIEFDPDSVSLKSECNEVKK